MSGTRGSRTCCAGSSGFRFTSHIDRSSQLHHVADAAETRDRAQRAQVKHRYDASKTRKYLKRGAWIAFGEEVRSTAFSFPK